MIREMPDEPEFSSQVAPRQEAPGAGDVVQTVPPATLEFTLAPEDAGRLARLPSLRRSGASHAVNLLWHDTVDRGLAARSLSLSKSGALWRLARLRPGPQADWPPVTPPPVLSEAPQPEALDPAPPADLVPVVAFHGRQRSYIADGVQLHLLHGAVRGVVAEGTACRLSLTGPPASLASLAMDLAGQIRLAVPRGTLAAEALALAQGTRVPAQHLGAPQTPPGQTVSTSMAQITGHLLDALLHWTALCDGASPEPVHQARVASRRLRSALSLFRHAVECPELDALGPALRDCAARLGAARDWDVFLEGAGARLGQALPEDPRCTAMLRAARRRRDQAYGQLRQFLASPEFRGMEIALACASSLRPWEAAWDQAPLRQDTGVFAATVLARRMRKVRHAGRGLSGLPVTALHELRKDCKRLRYAAEFFEPLFHHRAAKRFLQRLARLQETLGLLNDAAGASALMAQLGRPGRGYAAGLVEGFAAGAGGATRSDVARAWKRFRDASPFWEN